MTRRLSALVLTAVFAAALVSVAITTPAETKQVSKKFVFDDVAFPDGTTGSIYASVRITKQNMMNELQQTSPRESARVMVRVHHASHALQSFRDRERKSGPRSALSKSGAQLSMTSAASLLSAIVQESFPPCTCLLRPAHHQES